MRLIKCFRDARGITPWPFSCCNIVIILLTFLHLAGTTNGRSHWNSARTRKHTLGNTIEQEETRDPSKEQNTRNCVHSQRGWRRWGTEQSSAMPSVWLRGHGWNLHGLIGGRSPMQGRIYYRESWRKYSSTHMALRTRPSNMHSSS